MTPFSFSYSYATATLNPINQPRTHKKKQTLSYVLFHTTANNNNNSKKTHPSFCPQQQPKKNPKRAPSQSNFKTLHHFHATQRANRIIKQRSTGQNKQADNAYQQPNEQRARLLHETGSPHGGDCDFIYVCVCEKGGSVLGDGNGRLQVFFVGKGLICLVLRHLWCRELYYVVGSSA